MSLKHLSIVIIILFYIVGCSTQTVIMTEEYEDLDLEKQKISIIKLFSGPNISNFDDVTDDLGEGVPEEVYNKFFKERFTATIKNSTFFNEVTYVDTFDKSLLHEKLLNLSSSEQFRAYLPMDGKRLIELNSNYVLFLYSIDGSRPGGSPGMFVNGMMMGGSFEKLFHLMSFAIWDNNTGKLVSYGKVDEESTVAFAMTERNWSEVIRGLAIKVLRTSPFKLRF